MLGTRWKIMLLVGVLILGITAAAGAAFASSRSVTLDGFGDTGESPDTTGISTISVDATLANGLAGGTLTTVGKVNPLGNFYFDEFTGEVTCMLVSGKRIIIGAFGEATSRREVLGSNPIEEIVTLFPGTYMQVAVVESTDYMRETDGGKVTVRHNYESLGPHHEGLPSSLPPVCKKYRSLEAKTPADFHDTLFQIPAITRPSNGATIGTGKTTFAGDGEPETPIELYEVGHESEAKEVPVNAHGKWHVTISGLAAGIHEFSARAQDGSTVPASPVRFTVA